MAFNANLPDGGKELRESDNDLRANNDGLESALSEGHVFSTGGDQSGKHNNPTFVDLSGSIPSAPTTTNEVVLFNNGGTFEYKKQGNSTALTFADRTWVGDNFVSLMDDETRTGSTTYTDGANVAVNKASGGDHYLANVTDDANTNITTVYDSNNNPVSSIQVRGLDGTGDGYLNLTTSVTDKVAINNNEIWHTGNDDNLLRHDGTGQAGWSTSGSVSGEDKDDKGWVNLASGLVWQFGTIYCSNSVKTVTFPVTFSALYTAGVSTGQDKGTFPNDVSSNPIIDCSGWSASSMDVWVGGNANLVQWWAIGKL